MILWTVIRAWALINLVGIAMATAKGIYEDLTDGKDGADL